MSSVVGSLPFFFTKDLSQILRSFFNLFSRLFSSSEGLATRPPSFVRSDVPDAAKRVALRRGDG